MPEPEESERLKSTKRFGIDQKPTGFDDKYLYASGRGKVRAVNRRPNGKPKDLGVAALAIVGSVLYVRTGGQFLIKRRREENGKQGRVRHIGD